MSSELLPLESASSDQGVQMMNDKHADLEKKRKRRDTTQADYFHQLRSELTAFDQSFVMLTLTHRLRLIVADKGRKWM